MLGALALPGSSSGCVRPFVMSHKAAGVPDGLHMCRPTAVRRTATPFAPTAGPTHRKLVAPPRAVVQLYAAAAGLPFVLSSGAIAATGVGAGHEFSGAPFSLAMAAVAIALFAGEAYQRQAAGETFDLQAVTAKAFVGDSNAGSNNLSPAPSSPAPAVAVAPESVAAPPVEATSEDVPTYFGTLVPAAAVAAAAAMRSKLAKGWAAPTAKVAVPPPGAAARLAAVAAAPAALATAQAEAPLEEAASPPAPAAVAADEPEALAERHADKVRGLWDDFTARTSRGGAAGNGRTRGAGGAALASASAGAERLTVLPPVTATAAAATAPEPRASSTAAAAKTPAEAIAAARGGGGGDRAAVQQKSLASWLSALFASWWARIMNFFAVLTSSRRGSASSA